MRELTDLQREKVKAALVSAKSKRGVLAKLAKDVGLTPSQISTFIARKEGIAPEKMARVVDLLNIDLDAPSIASDKGLHYRASVLDDVPGIPMLDIRAQAGLLGGHGDAGYYDSMPKLHIPLPGFTAGRHYALQASGDSMAPYIKSGDWLICRAIPLNHLRPSEVYVAVCADGVVCKRIVPKPETGEVEFISDHYYPPYTRPATELLALFVVEATLGTHIPRPWVG